MTDSFPRQQARTRRFRLGAPAGFSIAPDGARVAFVRSDSGTDPVNKLVVVDVLADGLADERIAADPLTLLSGSEDLPPEEKARRERMRETTGGITSFSTDDAVEVASFALSGKVGITSLSGAFPARLLEVPGPAIDPRVDPTGRRVAWVADRSLHVANADGSDARVLVAPDSETVTWGLANFIAAEELERIRGFWWSPDGQLLIVERFDEEPVLQWYIANPADPAQPPRANRYPAAGTANPDVSLWVVSLDGRKVQIEWDHTAFEYVVSVRWSADGPPLIVVMDRSQHHALVLAVDAIDSAGTVSSHLSTSHASAELEDPFWVEQIPGTPRWTPSGSLITTAVSNEIDARPGLNGRLALDGQPLPSDTWIRAVLDSSEEGLLLAVNRAPTESIVVFRPFDGGPDVVLGPAEGWSTAVRSGPIAVVASTELGTTHVDRRVVRWHEGSASEPEELGRIRSHAEVPVVEPRAKLLSVGSRELAATVQFPRDHIPGSKKLPVIMHPYGGPHAQRVVESGRAFAETQWFADQGFCVIVADGRGTPGRGPEWERTVFHDLATAPLEDQIDALFGVAELYPDDIDPTRVGITGWSFGGYLSALAVLERPDVFAAGVAGAPVTEWRLYDTAYTERYLGHPGEDPEPYDATSLLRLAANLSRPLMVIHGLADDNVVVAHSLQLSSALTAAGKPHLFLPLSNVTHMTPQEEVAENLLLLQVEFFKAHV